MKWILGASVVAVIAGMAATMTVPAQTITPDEAVLRLFPRETNGVAFIDVAALRSAPLYDETVAAQFKAKMPADMVEFGEATGFVVDRDLDRVTVARLEGRRLVAVAHANYDKFKVEQYLNDKQMRTETYLGRVIFHRRGEGGFSFVDNLVIAGNTDAVKKVIDRLAAPADNLLQNSEIMSSIKEIEAGSQVWAVGEFDSRLLLPMGRGVPEQIVEPLKALQSGTYQMRIDHDLHAVATGRFGDSESARMTGDLLRGLVAIAKLQLSRQPDMIQLLDGVRVEQNGSSMTVNVDASGDALKKLQNFRKPAAE
jgi:hypothetical protein